MNEFIVVVFCFSFSMSQSTTYQLCLDRSSIKQELMCLAQGHNAVLPVRFKSATSPFFVKHTTTEPLCSLNSLAHKGL